MTSFCCVELSFKDEEVLPPWDYSKVKLEDFRDNARQSHETWTHLLRDLIEIDLSAIMLPCTRARALSCLADVEMYFKNIGIKRTVKSLLNSFIALAQAEETLRLTQPSPNLEAFIKESEEKIVDLHRNHTEVTYLEGFVSAELVTLAELFHYVKVEYTHLLHQMNGCYALLEENEGVVEHQEQLIAQARAILTAQQESGSDETPEEVVKRAYVNVVL